MIYLQKTEVVILKLRLPQKLHNIWVNTPSYFPPLLAIDGENLWCDRHGAFNADGPSVPSTPQQKRWYWSSQQTQGCKNKVHEWGDWAGCQHEIKMSSLARARSPTPGSFSSNRRIWAINKFVVTSGASGFCCELRRWAEKEREGRRWRLHLRVSTQWSPVNRPSHEAGSLMTEVGEAQLRTWTPSRMTSPSSLRLTVKKRPSTNCTLVSRWFYCTPSRRASRITSASWHLWDRKPPWTTWTGLHSRWRRAKLDINIVKHPCVCVCCWNQRWRLARRMFIPATLWVSRCKGTLVYGTWTKVALTVLTQQITKHTRTKSDKRTRTCCTAVAVSYSHAEYIAVVSSLLNGNKTKLKETQLFRDNLINVCKCGQISPGAQRWHDLQAGRTPLTINWRFALLTRGMFLRFFYLNTA